MEIAELYMYISIDWATSIIYSHPVLIFSKVFSPRRICAYRKFDKNLLQLINNSQVRNPSIRYGNELENLKSLSLFEKNTKTNYTWVYKAHH